MDGDDDDDDDSCVAAVVVVTTSDGLLLVFMGEFAVVVDEGPGSDLDDVGGGFVVLPKPFLVDAHNNVVGVNDRNGIDNEVGG